jgi:cytidylate kinase
LKDNKVKIAIDGPVASGKTSVGKKLASNLKIFFLDTGVMYRAVTWAVLNANIPVTDEESVVALTESTDIQILRPSCDDGRMNDVLVNGEDATWKIRQPSVNQNVSEISQIKGVRQILTQKQREVAEVGDIVMVGRDIGTVVLPDADYKFFLEASVQERAIRRFEETRKRGKNISLEEIIENVRHRDNIDSNRKIAPLIPAADAIHINTDNKSVEQVAFEIESIIRSKNNSRFGV